MLTITLARRGRKKNPFYHMIVRDKQSKRDSGIENLGYFDPLLSNDNPKRMKINLERFEYWKGVGAKPSQTVANLHKRFTAI